MDVTDAVSVPRRGTPSVGDIDYLVSAEFLVGPEQHQLTMPRSAKKDPTPSLFFSRMPRGGGKTGDSVLFFKM